MGNRYVQTLKVIEDGDMSANITSAVEIETKNYENFGIVVQWVGTAPVGEMKVDAKNGASSWSNLTLDPLAQITGNTGDLTINMSAVPFEKIRLSFARTSGIGTLQAYLTARQMEA